MFCTNCEKEVTLEESLKKNSGDRIMIRGECPHCKKWLKWVAYADSHIVGQALKLYATLPENEGLLHD